MTREEQLACLKDRPCDVCKMRTEHGCSSWECVFEQTPDEENSNREQEPCEDCISRQAVLDGVDTYIKKTQSTGAKDDFISFEELVVKALPPVTPKPKTGRWITQWNAAHQKEYYYCSECREEFSYDGETGIKMSDYDFCPNCGAKMEVEE